MKKVIVTLLCAVAPVLVSALPAKADTAPAVPSDKASFGVKLGFADPVNGDTRDRAGSSFTVGLNYMIAKQQSQSGLRYRFDLDYADFSKSGNKVQPISLLADVIKPFGGDISKGAYVGAGIGLVHDKVQAGSTAFKSLAPGGSDTGNTLAGQVLAGYNFSQHFFVEGNYHLNEQTKGVNSSYWAISVGTRF
jgi:hypothetical protein